MPQPANAHASRVSRHLEQARRNYGLYEALLASGQNLDWALTCLYYTAVHLVEAYGASQGRALFGTHPRREGFVSNELPAALCAYMTLHSASTNAKYKLYYPDAAQVRSYHDNEFGTVRPELAGRGVVL